MTKRKEVQAELEFHAKAWKLLHLGEDGELQPRGRARGAEVAGDHTTSVDSSGERLMIEGSESELLARVAMSHIDDQGRKLVYSSARMVVRLGPTPGYQPPVSDNSVRVEDGALEGVAVAHQVPRYMSWGYEVGSVDHTKGGHTVTKIALQHTQLKHHLLERVDAMSAKMADFVRTYHELQSQSKQVATNLAAIEEEVGIGKIREAELAAERSRYLNEREELKDKLKAANEAKTKTQYRESVTLQNMDLERQSFKKKLSSAIKVAQQRLCEVERASADACSIPTELDDLKSRFHDIGGANVYTAHRQHVGVTLEGRLQEAQDELAEMTPCLEEASRYLKESKSKSGDEIEQLEARIEVLEEANGAILRRAEASEKAAKAALSSGLAHTDVCTRHLQPRRVSSWLSRRQGSPSSESLSRTSRRPSEWLWPGRGGVFPASHWPTWWACSPPTPRAVPGLG